MRSIRIGLNMVFHPIVWIMGSITVLLGALWILTDPRVGRNGVTYLHTRGSTPTEFALLAIIAAGIFVPLELRADVEYTLMWAGFGCVIFGSAILIWAKYAMGAFWGPPAQHDTERQITLITGGPFRFSRNPIYVGIIAGVLGWSIALPSPLSWLVLLVAFFFYRATLKEERLLEEHFGEEYVRYKSRVRRFF